MSTHPTRTAVKGRPSTDTLNGNVWHRTSEQVKNNLDAKKSASTTVEWSIDTAKRQKQAHIANLEDSLQKENVLWEKQSVHPDLQDHNNMVKPTYPKVSIVLFCN